MTPSQLKHAVETANPDTKFFSRGNMKFAGDTMRNFGVRTTEARNVEGNTVTVLELYRKRTTPKGLSKSFYFDPVTFERVSIL